MNPGEIIKFLILRTIGNFLVLLMVCGFFATFGPAMYFEANYRVEQFYGITYNVLSAANAEEIKNEISIRWPKSVATSSAVNKPNVTNIPVATNNIPSLFVSTDNPNERIMVPKSTEFDLIIPKIGINENVFKNIDASNPDIYLDILKKGVAHAAGSAVPGQNGTTYIFAHSTDNFWNVGRYNAIFYLLDKLDKGDSITIFYDDLRYDYKVTDKKIVDSDQVDYMKANIGKGEKLILQTCWPPGTTWKRLLIMARVD